ncbi:MAG: DUF4870 domain-containing protein [Thainema sp.]
MSQANLVEQAKRGDEIAIAALITRSLQSQQIRARAQQRGHGMLQIVLEAAVPPERSQILPVVQKGMVKLSPPSIQTVHVSGWQSGQSAPAWTTEFKLPRREDTTSNPEFVSTEADATYRGSTRTPSSPKQVSNMQRVMARDTTWAMLCHLAALLPYLVTLGDAASGGLLTVMLGPSTMIVPIVVPLLVLLLKGDDSELTRAHAREALNFRLSMLLYWVAWIGLLVLSFILMVILIGFLMLAILIPLAIALAIFDIVCVILASANANSGRLYRYPLCIRFIKP